jgi:hypothetical protein
LERYTRAGRRPRSPRLPTVSAPTRVCEGARDGCPTRDR